VQNYRPEKIIFARAVKLQSFRKLGRETGVVCGVRDQGFGFVRSNVRDFNIFFRLSEVLGERGMPVKEGDICVGSCLSFDVVEETRGVPSPKMRAIRVQLLPSDSASSGSSHMPSSEGLHMDGDSHSPAGGRGAPASELEQQGGGGLTLLQAEVKGIIVSVAKRDAPGIIRASSIGDLGCNGESQGNQELYEAIKEFRDCKEIEEVILENVSSGLRKEYHSVLSEKVKRINDY
jgi:hypothetical protein